jgi:AcrR family transcriptional regulator
LSLPKNQTVRPDTTAQRRDRLRAALVAAAEDSIAKGGLGEMRARTLAEKAGCAVGAIYNAVEDLDELVLLANMRTLAALERDLTAACEAGDHVSNGVESAIAQLVRLAHGYLAFAAANTPRWRALFDHQMPGREVPEWYRNEQYRLFRHVEEPLRVLQPRASPKRRALLARSLFSAVHGLVRLGLEEKLQAIPLTVLREQMTYIVTTLGRGMALAD